MRRGEGRRAKVDKRCEAGEGAWDISLNREGSWVGIIRALLNRAGREGEGRSDRMLRDVRGSVVERARKGFVIVHACDIRGSR